jgi:hypothetical protein
VAEFQLHSGFVSEPDDFVGWATDPARTANELFTVELLIERMRAWSHWPFRQRALGFEESLQDQKERKFTPGYRPNLPRDEVEALQERAATVTHFQGPGMSDRPLRDLKALSFFPALEDLGLTGCDTPDLSPLAALPKVKRLMIGEYDDLTGAHQLRFSDCGEKPALERVFLSLRQPWPDLRALAQWPNLREVYFNGNILAFAEVEALPAAESVQAHNWVNSTTPLRDLRTFPALPKVKRLGLERTSSLEGIERYQTVLNLELGGTFADLAPLAALENVTFLKLTSEDFTDLSPLIQMPKLRELVLVRERPIDLSPLAEAPQLRRVDFERCTIMRTELAALNAGLLPEAIDFLLDPPRRLEPLKFYVVRNANEAGKKHFVQRTGEVTEMRKAFYAGDAALERAEARSFLTALHAGLNGLLGRGWGLVEILHATSAGRTHINLKRFIDTARTREVIQLLREHSARSRHPWVFGLMVEPHGDMSYEVDALKELDEKAKEPERHWLAQYVEPDVVLEEGEEQARRYREKYELLEREHLYNLQEQQGGGAVEAGLPPLTEDKDENELDDEEEEDEEPLSAATEDDDDTQGGVAIAPPPPAPPGTRDLSDDLRFALEVFEDCIVVGEGWLERARYGLGEAPVEWTEQE